MIMTGTLKVDTAKLTSTASSFNSTANTIKSLTTSMTETVGQLTGNVWSGDAQQKYTSQFNGLQDDINRMISMINEHVTDLQEMAKNYESAEQTNQETASTLLSDVIS
jgi:WXG100 family type VII secretion target